MVAAPGRVARFRKQIELRSSEDELLNSVRIFRKRNINVFKLLWLLVFTMVAAMEVESVCSHTEEYKDDRAK